MMKIIYSLLIVLSFSASPRALGKNENLNNRAIAIARLVSTTDKNLHRLKYVRQYIEIERAPLEAWFQNGSPQKINLKGIYGSGPLGDGVFNTREEYYFHNGRVILVRKTLAENSSRTGNRWKNYRTTQLYFSAGKLLRWSLNGKKLTPREYEEMEAREKHLARAHQFLKRAQKLLAKQSAAQKKSKSSS